MWALSWYFKINSFCTYHLMYSDWWTWSYQFFVGRRRAIMIVGGCVVNLLSLFLLQNSDITLLHLNLAWLIWSNMPISVYTWSIWSSVFWSRVIKCYKSTMCFCAGNFSCLIVSICMFHLRLYAPIDFIQ